MNTKTCYDKFIFHCRYEKNLSKKTILAYKTDFNQFIEFYQNHYNTSDPEINEIDKDIIKEYLESVMKRFQVKSVKRKNCIS